MVPMQKLKRLPEVGRPVGPIGSASLCVAVLTVFAFSGTAHAQKFELQPSLETRLTYSDNIRASGDDKRAGWVAEVSPGLGGVIGREGGRVKANLNARLSSTGYSSDEGWRSPGLGLQANGEVEALEDLLFVEADASIRRTNLNLFSGRAEDDFLETSRTNETRAFRVSPRLEFALGALANGQLRYSQNWLSGGSNTLTAQRRGEWALALDSARSFGPFGWGLSYQRADTSYRGDDLNDVREESWRGSVFYTVTPQFRVRGIVGHERNDFAAGRTQSNRITGAGFDWFPSARTSLSGFVEDRFFGNGYDLSLSHRMARSNLQLSFGRDVTSSVQRFGSVFSDPFFLLRFDDPFLVAQFPDPLEREDVVRAILGLTADSFVSNAYFVDRRARAAYTINGVRNSVSFAYIQSDRSRVSGITGLRGGDLFTDSDRVKNKSLSVGFSHRLTPHSSLNAAVARSIAERAGGLSDRTRRLTTSLGYSARFGHRTVGGLTYRHQRSSGANDFTENVISATMNMRF